MSIEGVDPEGAYRVQIDDEPARYHAPRVVKTIQAQLSNSHNARGGDAAGATLRTRLPGITTFLDLAIDGDDDNFRRTHAHDHRARAGAAAALARRRAAATPEDRPGADDGPHD